MPSPGTSRFISTACRSPSSSSTAGSPDAATSRSCATLRPATLATLTTCRADSSSRSRRTSSTSARSSGTQLPGSAAAPTSSSTKNALPSARRTIALSSFSRIALVREAGDQQRGPGRRRAGRAGAARRRAAATTRRPGGGAGGGGAGRRSGTTRRSPPGASKGRENRKLSRSRVDWSAQWQSSMTSSTGDTAAASSSRACTAANRSARSSISPSTRPEAGAPSAAASTRRPGWSRARRVRLGHALDDLGQLGLEPAQHLGEREVGQRAVAEVEAVPGDHAPALVDREVAQLHQQPGLADAGVTGQHDVHRLGGRVPRGPQTTGRRATKQSPSARRLGRSGSGWSCVRPHRP